MRIIAGLGAKDSADGKYYDSMNAGGILGTSHSSSVNGCYLHLIAIRATGTRAFVVGLADGTEDANSVVVGNITGKFKGMVSVFPSNGVNDKNGVSTSGNIKDSGEAMTDSHGDDYVRFLENKYISRYGNDSGDSAPYSNILLASALSLISPAADPIFYEIENKEMLKKWAAEINGGKPYRNYYILLSEDVIFEEGEYWTPINAFNAENSPLNNTEFDGGGHTISYMHFKPNSSSTHKCTTTRQRTTAM